MLAAAGLAFYRGFEIHRGRDAYFAFGLGLVALGIAAWHLRGALPGRGDRARDHRENRED